MVTPTRWEDTTPPTNTPFLENHILADLCYTLGEAVGLLVKYATLLAARQPQMSLENNKMPTHTHTHTHTLTQADTHTYIHKHTLKDHNLLYQSKHSATNKRSMTLGILWQIVSAGPAHHREECVIIDNGPADKQHWGVCIVMHPLLEVSADGFGKYPQGAPPPGAQVEDEGGRDHLHPGEAHHQPQRQQ